MADHEHAQIATLLSERNKLDAAFAGVLARPTTSHHLGEWTRRRGLDTQLEADASAADIDGRNLPPSDGRHQAVPRARGPARPPRERGQSP